MQNANAIIQFQYGINLRKVKRLRAAEKKTSGKSKIFFVKLVLFFFFLQIITLNYLCDGIFANE